MRHTQDRAPAVNRRDLAHGQPIAKRNVLAHEWPEFTAHAFDEGQRLGNGEPPKWILFAGVHAPSDGVHCAPAQRKYGVAAVERCRLYIVDDTRDGLPSSRLSCRPSRIGRVSNLACCISTCDRVSQEPPLHRVGGERDEARGDRPLDYKTLLPEPNRSE